MSPAAAAISALFILAADPEGRPRYRVAPLYLLHLLKRRLGQPPLRGLQPYLDVLQLLRDPGVAPGGREGVAFEQGHALLQVRHLLADGVPALTGGLETGLYQAQPAPHLGEAGLDPAHEVISRLLRLLRLLPRFLYS